MTTWLTRRTRTALALLIGLVAFGLFFRVELGSGLARSKGGRGDDRFVHFSVEWISTCLAGDRLCRDLWSPPIFHPEVGTLAQTDPALGLGVLYAGLRALGLDPSASFLLLQMLLLGLAAAAAYWMLRRAMGFSTTAAALGAALFAFGAPVAAQADHPQLFASFPIPLALGLLTRILDEEAAAKRRRLWLLLASTALAQAYLNLTLFWLFGFWLFWAALVAFCLPATRRNLHARLAADLPVVLAAGAIAAAACYPLAARMLEARDRIGGVREIQKWYDFLPQPESWLNVSAANWVWGRIADWAPIRGLPFPWEHELGFGLATTLLCAAGIWWGRRRPGVQALAGGAALVGLLTLRWPGGFTCWSWIHSFWPGVESVRAVGRIALVLLAPAAAALALAFERVEANRRVAVPVLIAVLVLFEQQRSFASYSIAGSERRSRALAGLVPGDCRAFYWSPLRPEAGGWAGRTQIEAMWAALLSGVPTANGYSGYTPIGWELFEHRIDGPARRQALADRIAYWALLEGLEPGELCWLITEGKARSPRLTEVVRVDPARSPWQPPADATRRATPLAPPEAQ